MKHVFKRDENGHAISCAISRQENITFSSPRRADTDSLPQGVYGPACAGVKTKIFWKWIVNQIFLAMGLRFARDEPRNYRLVILMRL